MTESGNVLIVEDEVILAQLLEYDLQRLGYRVLDTCATGEDALAAVVRERPDLVMMDITLQGDMDGVQTAERMLTDHGVPSVFLTAHSDAATVRRATAAEPFAYLRKPYNEKDLELVLTVTMNKIAAEAKRERQRKLLAKALEELPTTAVIMCGSDGRVALFNSEAERLTGWERTAAVGRAFGEVCRLRAPEGDSRPLTFADLVGGGSRGLTLVVEPRGEGAACPVLVDISKSADSGTVVTLHRHGAATEVGGEMVVVCGWCRLIRMAGGWERLEAYLGSEGKRVSHGMCTSCLDKFSSDLLDG